ncbi:iron chelate uptake ABC transporter family permease subunit, partial [Enterococcus faecalis]
DMGEVTPFSGGIAVKKERNVSLRLAEMLAASAICVRGGINFLCLLAPHIARKCGFTQQKQELPLAALFGSLLLLVSDTIGRQLPGNGEMPGGIIVAIIGAPYFLYLLIKTSDSL